MDYISFNPLPVPCITYDTHCTVNNNIKKRPDRQRVKRLRFFRLSFYCCIRAHAMHDGCESGSSLEVVRRLFLLSSASNRATIDLRLTTFVCVASSTATMQMKLLKVPDLIKSKLASRNALDQMGPKANQKKITR